MTPTQKQKAHRKVMEINSPKFQQWYKQQIKPHVNDDAKMQSLLWRISDDVLFWRSLYKRERKITLVLIAMIILYFVLV